MTVTKSYTEKQVRAASLAYFNGDELAATTWMSRYALKNKEGKFLELTPSAMHHRLARELARAENKWAPVSSKSKKFKALSPYGKQRQKLTQVKIFNYFDQFRYMVPQGSIMASLGNSGMFASLSNCVVLPPLYDSYGGIFYTDQQLAQLFKRRCGVGIDLSALRPAGMRVSNAAGSSSGAVSFMDRFSFTTREVAQQGRRGALMMTLDVAHPDIGHFVSIKQDLTRITGANISVRISDAFMLAVEANDWFDLKFPVDSKNPDFVKRVKARKLWDEIISCAAATGEPGIIFWDRQHQYSTSSVYPGFKNVSTNPCSEIAMQGGDSCRLMAINLYSLVEDPFLSTARFDFKKFYEVIYEAQRLLDDLVELELDAIERILDKVNRDPEPAHIKDAEVRTWKLLLEQGKAGRRTGLGFTAMADTLAALGIKLSDRGAVNMTEKIMKEKCRAEFDSTIDMALERGKFKAFNPKTENASLFVQMLKKEFPDVYLRMMKHGRRNISISTVSPSGTVSLLTQTSSGIEPVFMLAYTRRRKVRAETDNTHHQVDLSGDAWEEFEVNHPKLQQWKVATGLDDPARSPYYGSTAHDLNWKSRLRLQAVVQKYTTHSISSTINLPAETTRKQVGRIYLEAWKLGLKGITVYREGARNGVLIAVDKNSAGSDQSASSSRQEKELKKQRATAHVVCATCGTLNTAHDEAGCSKCISCGNTLCG